MGSLQLFQDMTKYRHVCRSKRGHASCWAAQRVLDLTVKKKNINKKTSLLSLRKSSTIHSFENEKEWMNSCTSEWDSNMNSSQNVADVFQ